MTNVEYALQFVTDGMSLGLGSGRAAERFISALGDRVRAGLTIRAVPTSRASAALARQAGIPLVEFDAAIPLDLTVDGADEVDSRLDLIKGYGHALVREKVVAAAARQFVILIGPEEVEDKLVDVLGRRGRVPVEVLPFAERFCVDRIHTAFGYLAEPVRDHQGERIISDNGNRLIDVRVGRIADPYALDAGLRAIPGVIGTGLFLGMADVVLIQRGDGRTEARPRTRSPTLGSSA